MPASHEPSAGTAPNILLIEEYDALAAAITSALKKFAPDHRIRTVTSLSEAEMVAATAAPQLVIIDFDPPHPHAVEFLGRMAANFPEARVLIIASGISTEFRAERFGPNGVQFVKKPFELAEFGAAVQALLGPWTDALSGDSRGTLRDLNARDVVPIECVSAATTILKLKSESGQEAEVHILDGQICHASTAGADGPEALQEVVGWRKTQAKEGKRLANSPRTILEPWDYVFLQALRESRKAAPLPPISPIAVPPVAETKQPAKPARDGKKIVIVDDTEMLLIFVEDVLTTADSTLQISTASGGEEGVRCVGKILPDLVLLDYSIPDLRGDEVCGRLLANKATAKIPVVIMSGHVAEMLATEERYENVVATIAKPFMSAELIELVTKLLAEGATRPARQKKTVSPPTLTVTVPLKPKPKPVPTVAAPKPATLVKSDTPPATAGKQGRGNNAPSPAPPPAAPKQVIQPPPKVELPKQEPIQIVVPETVHAPLTRDLRPAELALFDSPAVSPAPRWVRPTETNGVITLGIGMEVVSVQFTSRFQVDTICARPSPSAVSLIQPAPAPGVDDRLGSGFELGAVQLDSDGRIKTIRVLPMRRPAGFVRGRNGFDINDVALVNGRAFVQLTAGMTVPMIMQVTASVKVSEVELSERFEVSQLVLVPNGIRVKAMLDPQSRGAIGADFDIARIALDRSGRITEFVFHLIAGAPTPLH